MSTRLLRGVCHPQRTPTVIPSAPFLASIPLPEDELGLAQILQNNLSNTQAVSPHLGRVRSSSSAPNYQPGTSSPLSHSVDQYPELTVTAQGLESPVKFRACDRDEAGLEGQSPSNHFPVAQNLDESKNPSEEDVVDRLLSQGPKLLFISLPKQEAREFYDAVPEDEKERVSVHPINRRRSLVKWANTIKEHRALEGEVVVIPKRGLSCDITPEECLLQDTFPEHSDSDSRLKATAQRDDGGGMLGCLSSSAPADIVYKSEGGVQTATTLDITAQLPTCDSDVHKRQLPGTPRSAETHDSEDRPGKHDVSSSSLPDPVGKHRPDDFPSSSAGKATRVRGCSMLAIGICALSATSAALGGFLAWVVLAYEPFSEPVVVICSPK
ncbi:hypothetical protein FA13DRAFT_1802540 [Coprinellus micaceus]|uniref:Uncharacterized protein n=1 Tax=Coprinellus micaceus TaxID=71717 RepID=A0A4Y7SE01_COPMI|nr:hypothetical protein FA13DRAFT_1802540 [Coprinellus micaceus]